MKTAAKIFLRDLRRILRNPVAVVVTLGVCVIPSLYAWFNILANWDPYNNTSTVPVAVVNEDQGANAGSRGFVNAGDMVVERLSQNDQLGWDFTDEGAAREGVGSGRYYAAIIIPPDFSSTLAGVLEGKTAKADIQYLVNEKENAVAPKVTDTGATTLEDQVGDEFVKVVGEVVTQRAADLAGTVQGQARDASRGALADLQGVQDSLGELQDRLSDASQRVDGARGGVGEARQALQGLSGDGDGVASQLDDGLASIGAARGKARSLAAELDAAVAKGSAGVSGLSTTASHDLGRLAGDVGWAQGRLDDAIARLQTTLQSTQELKVTLEGLRSTTASLQGAGGGSAELGRELQGRIDAEVSVLAGLSDAQAARLEELRRVSSSVSAGADDVRGLSSSVNDAIQGSASELDDLRSALANDSLPQLEASLDQLADAGAGLAGAARQVSPTLARADGSLVQLDQTLVQAKAALDATAGSLATARDGVSQLADDLAAIQGGTAWRLLSAAGKLDAQRVGELLGSPVELRSQAVFPVQNYGSGVTPFYTNLALWVGGFVLVAIYKREVDLEGLGVGRIRPWQGYLGRWALFSLLGLVQALVCCLGDLALGIQCLHPVAFVLAGLVESFVYVSVVFALCVAFKHIGMALGVLLVIVQIPGSSGTYPIEMMPGFFQALNPWLPFTYGINAMREAIAGYYGNLYLQNLLVLLAFLAPALLVGLAARRRLVNINALFDARLAQTELMVSERVAPPRQGPGIRELLRAISGSEEYRERLTRRAARFEEAYPTLVRRGFACLVVIPVALCALLFALDAKMPLLVLWIVSLVVICSYLIVVEYLHSHLSSRAELGSLPHERLHELLDEELGQKGGDAR